MIFSSLLPATQIKEKGRAMNKNNPLWIMAIAFIFILLIFNLALFTKKYESAGKLGPPETNNLAGANTSLKGKTETTVKCPDAEGGDKNAFLQIKYFYSDFCPWCIKEEPILQKLVKDYGNFVYISWYNINTCPDLVEKYKVSGVPTLVFSTTDNQAEYSHYGFTYEKDLKKLICDVTGGC